MTTPTEFQFTDYQPYDFANRRHIGPSPAEMDEMLKTVGYDSLDGLIAATVPASIRQSAPLVWGKAMSEREALDKLRETANKNKALTSLIGQGYYGTITPPVIQRNILENPAWYTAYTPYQPEISQGRLEALLNFQTMICDLTGLDVANASLLDEATAAAEAMAMAERVAKSKAKAFFVDSNCHPQTIAVIQTRAEPLGWGVVVGNPFTDLNPGEVFGALFQYPGTHGHVSDFTPLINALHNAQAIAAVAADPLALLLLKSPGEMGADIAIGSSQRFGVPVGYGGPHAAYMAVKDAIKRSMPGRLVGVSVDSRGNRAYRLSLQTREQHIRREKATSNICTAQVLLAVMASMYAVFHGPQGLKAIAQQVHQKTVLLAKGLEKLGFTIEPETFFDTITLEVGHMQGLILRAAVAEGVNLRKVGTTKIGISLDERTRPATLEAVWRAFGGNFAVGDFTPDYRLPTSLLRTSQYLTHPIFHMNRAESEMTRYIRRLSDRDLALDRAMIPLGSCTMKLNATAEMLPITWPEFSDIHPFAPADQALGYQEMIDDLSEKLCAVTGYDAISMQPNSGAQGEYAGLLTIRNYHLAKGDTHRTVCLIPTSAHGTNPASAQMAGMLVVPVKALDNGDVDLADFRTKAEQHSTNLSCCMITYPSTHGVFEETVREICEITHAHGGQVYLDGANMNAMVGIARPGDIGSDVSHLNLHKTFCIPHGGGGPGMGPIGVKAHLTPYLPGHVETDGRPGAVSAAPYGSPSILPISWSYCLMMGGEGLTQATKVAILNANYIAARLTGAYDVLYTSASGRVAHECIIDTRPLADSAGVTVDDVAKRLIDCGFHAPTMSWPVAGTLMIEPTESETKAELDRFCTAMLAIREEARAIEDGRMDKTNNPLKNAPHTVEDLVGEWDRPYSRDQACYPPGAFRVDKYWSSVNRVDNVYGDRNLVCTCPPMSEYAEAAE
ncbi:MULTISPECIES: aminomethyl-transferring glycine dehydrogenase [Rhizobium/Agrobacterium group]|uniref:Glycine dehydrogenase (decarboxylating) n=2 Tax=Rhizobium/Agrobacterium group TaxID=227290 RepID=GCSP_ALLAM|nr:MULTISPECIES: aminomethyl-transferring glycine dehydrogenase [Rhizobium/Agrobacterium group]B9JWI2.1 RecName: Full=Glycine dehydrogenase (decarboxylating); AltName: Full=Glycine cleavage system P-protein; AltName: Full=Glycine decarboxylase; AltName: Full=Glycine dehydrogenase (aminomethyl-transferring) [Allorhizobium ampelinum S4]ACM36610.1 glycine cleavage system protein P2 [Allorhizobium ampelinum S4]MUO27489.1 aminomethyl-transferring glycine dehydrogenase [Agrobacterium vitis]MUO42061.1